MKVAGFTIARNVVKYDYPIKEAIASVLPLVDVFYIGLGDSEDETEIFLKSLNNPKLIFLHSQWDLETYAKSNILAHETNKVLSQIPDEYDWAFYIQADEVVHEKDHKSILAGMQLYVNYPKVEGLLFKYRHFYGSYDFLADSRAWYRREVRIIKNRPYIHSHRDAQGFRKGDAKRINAVPIEAHIHHYGWVRHPKVMISKVQGLASRWTQTKSIGETLEGDSFDYSQIDSLKRFKGTHPKLMKERIAKLNWSFSRDVSEKKFNSIRYKLLMLVERYTGYRIGEYRNYKVIKP